uniref:Ion transport domain-containing protein n=1 Tax=Knipowitschia caucasica TaxID=637954 RepID=A0AAV2JVC5_KNICA
MSVWILDSFGFRSLMRIIVGFSILILAVEHHQQPDWLTKAEYITRTIGYALFLAELVLRLCAMSYRYFLDMYYVLDFIMVITSTLEMILPFSGDLKYLFRSLRVLRLLSIIRLLPYLRKQLVVLGKSLSQSVPLLLMIEQFVIVFSVLQEPNTGDPAAAWTAGRRLAQNRSTNSPDRSTGNQQNVQNTGPKDKLGTSELRTPNTHVSRHPNRHNHIPVAPEGRRWIRAPMRTCHGLILDISGTEPHAQSAQATPSLQSHINTKIWRDHNGDWHRQSAGDAYLFGCKFKFLVEDGMWRKNFDHLKWAMVTVFQREESTTLRLSLGPGVGGEFSQLFYAMEAGMDNVAAEILREC